MIAPSQEDAVTGWTGPGLRGDVQSQQPCLWKQTMRIIAGSKRGMNLFSPETYDSRLITDRIKESLFNVLANYGLPADAVVADLFAGVGSLGLEALSRGARFVTFVENDRRTAAVLEKNIKKARFVEKSKIVVADTFSVGALVNAALRALGVQF